MRPDCVVAVMSTSWICYFTVIQNINTDWWCQWLFNAPKKKKVNKTRYTSVFSADLFEILKSQGYIKNSTYTKFVIYSDSLSAIESIKNNKNKNALNIKVNQVLSSIQDKSIVFEWVPSHTNILGNELADKAAKKATQ